MNQIRESQATLYGRSKVKSWLLGMLVATLVSSNVAILLCDEIYGVAFNAITSVLGAMLPDAVLSRVVSRSPMQSYRVLSKSNVELKASIAEMRQIAAKRSEVTGRISGRVARRAALNATKNVGAVAVEAVPVIGVAAMLALTASDLYDDCQTLKDMNELNITFGQSKHEDETTICGLKVPGFQAGASEVPKRLPG